MPDGGAISGQLLGSLGSSAIGGILGGGGSSQAGTTTNTTSPWAQAIPYLLGQAATTNPDGTTTPAIPGLLPGAAAQFGQSQWSPQMQGANNTYQAQLQARGNQGEQANQAAAQAQIFGNKAAAGGYDANISPVGNVNASTVDPTKAFGSLGAADPTGALQKLLSGSADNPYLTAQISGLGTDISNNLNQNILPQLRSGAVASGQYGSSRQGIAEGLAAQSANQQFANQSANIRSGAYQQAQALQGQAANNLAGLGLNTGQFNANALNNMGQFNANLGLNNNSQAMQSAQNKVANATAGLNAIGNGLGFTQAGNSLQDSTYGANQTAFNTPNAYNWQQLQNYQGIVNPASGMGGTQTSPYFQNTGAGVLGGAAAGAGLWNKYGSNLGFGSSGNGAFAPGGSQFGSDLGYSSPYAY